MAPVYKPVRDNRFYYASEALDHIEATQCTGCVFADDEYPATACSQVNGANILFEIPVPEFLDYGDHLECNKRRSRSHA